MDRLFIFDDFELDKLFIPRVVNCCLVLEEPFYQYGTDKIISVLECHDKILSKVIIHTIVVIHKIHSS